MPRQRRPSVPRSFNPRPPLLAGDACNSCVCTHVISVSIHARHYWRAMRCWCPSPGCLTWFQSTPAITGGRCLNGLSIGFMSKVSIHARHYWRAMRWVGRRTSMTSSCFNPRPPLLAGDARNDRQGRRHALVSIHARHYWRAMHGQADLAPVSADVSIHARHYWRAMLRFLLFLRRKLRVSIHARHYWRAMRHRARLLSSIRCFNPRPPLLAGDAIGPVCFGVVDQVSIHARHYWRAMHVSSGQKLEDAEVSIHARHYWRAMLCRCCPMWTTWQSFNPRPPLLAGDAVEERHQTTTT